MGDEVLILSLMTDRESRRSSGVSEELVESVRDGIIQSPSVKIWVILELLEINSSVTHPAVDTREVGGWV